jgi:hyperosmotically inducible protein
MDRPLKSIAPLFALSAVLFGVGQLGAAQDAQRAPDNTRTNKRDRSSAERTADQAKETTSDRDIMQKIRKAIMADKSLSIYGHNVKVISEHGKVTLKGPVHTEAESKSIEDKAIGVAGVGNVTNQIAVERNTTHRN